jgi:hypothetical protein
MNCTVSDNIVHAVTEKYKNELVNLEVDLDAAMKKKYLNEKDKTDKVKSIKDKIEKTKKNIKNIEERINETTECNICQLEFDNKTLLDCCSNSFCYSCISTWIYKNTKDNKSSKCPCCNSLITIDNIIIENSNPELQKNASSKKEKEKLLDKPEKMLEILKDKDPKTSKILIFSENDASFRKFEEKINGSVWKYRIIKGNVNTVNSIITKYKTTDEVNMILANSLNFGSGLNLENTTDIIIYHKMDKDLESQVIGRAQRPGRTSSINIYKLNYENE